MMRYWKMVVGLLVMWLVTIIYMSNSVFPNAGDNNTRTERQLQRAMIELQKLRLQNQELHLLANELKDIKVQSGRQEGGDAKEVEMLQKRLEKATEELRQLSLKGGSKGPLLSDVAGLARDGLQDQSAHVPSLEHEMARRKMERTALEFWYYIRSELKKLREQTTENSLVRRINAVLAASTDYQKVLRTDLYRVANTVDNQAEWRLAESQKLGDLVQRRLKYLQNPDDCKNARKMVCNMGKGCGYGCQLHHATYCLMLAYATERTLILDSKGWRYASGGWETVFQPLSDTCTSKSGRSSRNWGPDSTIRDIQVVEMPIIDSLHPRPAALPLSIPEDLADRLLRFHGDPSVWWIGQFVTYLTRPNAHLQAEIEKRKEKLGFDNPIVGVHVRRTDKVGLEAAFHGVEEYMTSVDEWFDLYEKRHPGVKRQVFLASDDPTVLTDAMKSYPNYKFISDNDISKTAGLGSRYSDESLRGVILDIHLLSLCDYLVCTFSSQVCRVAYELMQPMRGDASTWFKSLDDIYYFGGQNGHNVEAVESHQRNPDNNDIDLQPGDLVGIAGNHWNGFSKGKSQRTGRTGLFPSYKVVNKIERVQLPTYPEVPDVS